MFARLAKTIRSDLIKSAARSWQHGCRHLGPRLQENRRYLDKRLPEIGFRVLPGQGTYFMIADIRPLLPPGSADTDVDFCQKLTEDVGVTLIPVRAVVVHSRSSQLGLFRMCTVARSAIDAGWCSRVSAVAWLVPVSHGGGHCFYECRTSGRSEYVTGVRTRADETSLLL